MSPEQKTLSKKFLIFRFVMSLYFVSAIWLYFYRLFMTDAEIGTLDAIAFAIGLLVEVPSGVLADKFGRSKILKIGLVVGGIGLAMQAVGGFWIIMAFQIGFTASQSLVSGADDALFYDKLKFKENSVHWRKLVIRGDQAMLAAILVATVFGGIMYDFNPQMPWVLNGIALIAAAIVVWSIKDRPEKRKKKTISQSVKEYTADIAAGFREFKKPKFRIYVPLIITVQGLFCTFALGILDLVLLDRFTFSPFWGSIVLSTCGVISIAVLHLMHKYSEKMHEKRILTAVTFMAIIALVLSAFDIGWWGFAVILLLYLGEYIIQPFISEILNKQAPGNLRSTVLSVASFLKILPYVALAPIIGLLNTYDLLEIFLICWAILSALAWLYYFVSKRKDRLIVANFDSDINPNRINLEIK